MDKIIITEPRTVKLPPPRTVSNASMMLEGEEGKDSMSMLGSESAYGGSGRSSMVSTIDRWGQDLCTSALLHPLISRKERDRQLESLTVPPENGAQDVGLLMKLQVHIDSLGFVYIGLHRTSLPTVSTRKSVLCPPPSPNPHVDLVHHLPKSPNPHVDRVHHLPHISQPSC